jgi:hypothetical protein
VSALYRPIDNCNLVISLRLHHDLYRLQPPVQAVVVVERSR